MKKALIVQGGWDGHQPREVGAEFRNILESEGFQVQVEDSLDAFANNDLKSLQLIVPIWTMGEISPEQLNPVVEAVAGGVGIAGCHGGMCDSFRNATEWQFMTGGQWVAHPGNDGTRHTVHIVPGSSPIVEGIQDFEVSSEMYYMHVDPAIKVLATLQFPVADGPHAGNGKVEMPAVWTKMYGQGRVFYCSLGHQADIIQMPPVREIMRRGFAWAARESVQ